MKRTLVAATLLIAALAMFHGRRERIRKQS